MRTVAKCYVQTFSIIGAVQGRLWKLCVWLFPGVWVVYYGACSQYGYVSCHWRLTVPVRKPESLLCPYGGTFCCIVLLLIGNQPHHPSRAAVFKPTFRSTYESNITASRLVGVRFRHLLQRHISTYRTLLPTGSSKSHLRKLSAWSATSDSSDTRGVQQPP
jgi:hypothetical protein